MKSGEAVVTGAFSFTGAAVSAELRRRGWTVRTLTGRTRPAGAAVAAGPLRFDRDYLVRNLADADLFVNTFWIRLPMLGESFDLAVEKSKLLLSCAREAGVGRIVHVSVSNAPAGRNLGYYRGKHDVELFLKKLDVSHAVVRPTLIVGPNDVLTNNIAWFLRTSPVFLVPGDGSYRLQPVTLPDAGRIIADAAESAETIAIDAAGPEVYTFREYVDLVRRACGLKRILLRASNAATLAAVRVAECILRDRVLAREELLGLQQELLLSHEPARGKESVGGWLSANGHALGRNYVNDTRRHFTTAAKDPLTT